MAATTADDNEVQWALLTELSSVFRQTRTRIWLRGGWALDFWLGRITRPHDDIDLVTWSRHGEGFEALLAKTGYSVVRRVGAQVDFAKQGQDVSVLFIAHDHQGQLTVPGIPDWVWREDALTSPPRTLAGLTFRVLSVRHLIEEKEGYDEATGRPLRSKDRSSLALLHELELAGKRRNKTKGDE